MFTIPSDKLLPSQVDQIRSDKEDLRNKMALIAMYAATALAGNADATERLQLIKDIAMNASDYGR